MPDIRLVWDQEAGEADWTMGAGDLATGDDLATAILVSLFTDRLASPDARPLDGDRRGWWADSFADRPLGSELWRLDRAVRTAATLRDAEGYARVALAWLVADGVAARVDVEAAWLSRTALGLRVVVVKPDRVAVPYAFAWEF